MLQYSKGLILQNITRKIVRFDIKKINKIYRVTLLDYVTHLVQFFHVLMDCTNIDELLS